MSAYNSDFAVGNNESVHLPGDTDFEDLKWKYALPPQTAAIICSSPAVVHAVTNTNGMVAWFTSQNGQVRASDEKVVGSLTLKRVKDIIKNNLEEMVV